ncbi:hypothetical protein [Streptomyces griseus]|uniref:hypothetical protein n=1 Tax=Streptomyces griseus TaxID=1911 RepID=UPI0018FEF23D|nr:hypothetical protein [Streptomyces griseus]
MGSQEPFADQSGICSDQVHRPRLGRARRTSQRRPQAQPADAQSGPRTDLTRRRDPQVCCVLEWNRLSFGSIATQAVNNLALHAAFATGKNLGDEAATRAAVSEVVGD